MTWLEKKVERQVVPSDICDEQLNRYKVTGYYQMPDSCVMIAQTEKGLYIKKGELYTRLENLMETK